MKHTALAILATAMFAYAGDAPVDESVFQEPEASFPFNREAPEAEVAWDDAAMQDAISLSAVFVIDLEPRVGEIKLPPPPPVLQSTATSPVQLEFAGCVRKKDISTSLPMKLQNGCVLNTDPPDKVYACLILHNHTSKRLWWDDRAQGRPMIYAKDEEDPHIEEFRKLYGVCGTGCPDCIGPYGDLIPLWPVEAARSGMVASMRIRLIDADKESTEHLLRSQPLEEAVFTERISGKDVSPAKAEVTVRPCPFRTYRDTKMVYITYHNPTDHPIEIDHAADYAPYLKVTTRSGQRYEIGLDFLYLDAPAILPAGMSYTTEAEFPEEVSLEEDGLRIHGPRSNVRIETKGE